LYCILALANKNTQSATGKIYLTYAKVDQLNQLKPMAWLEFFMCADHHSQEPFLQISMHSSDENARFHTS